MSTRRHGWERQPTESAPAFAAFVVYRDLGLTRNQQDVAQELGKSRTLIARWSSQHVWVLRVHAYDAEQDRMWLLERHERVREAARRNADIASKAMDLIAQKIASLQTKDLDANSLARFIDAASRLEQLALGGPTMNISVSGQTPGAGSLDMGLLTDEERQARMRVLQRELTARIQGDGPDNVRAIR